MSDTIIMYENGKAVGGEGHPTNADEITFNNEDTDLVSEEVESAIKEVNAKFDKGSVSVTADGVKTNGTLLNELFALIDSSKINGKSYIVTTDTIYHLFSTSATAYSFSAAHCATSAASIRELTLKASGSTDMQCRFDSTPTTTITNVTSTVLSNGTTITLYY